METEVNTDKEPERVVLKVDDITLSIGVKYETPKPKEVEHGEADSRRRD